MLLFVLRHDPVQFRKKISRNDGMRDERQKNFAWSMMVEISSTQAGVLGDNCFLENDP